MGFINTLLLDTDADMISDYCETHFFDTNPLQADSDGDRYGDGFEIENRFDPRDQRSPAKLAYIAVDGIQEKHDFALHGYAGDPEGDQRAKTDIRALEAYIIDGTLFFQVGFNTLERGHGTSIRLIRDDGNNFWIAGKAGVGHYLFIQEFREGSEWTKSPVDPKVVTIAENEIFEARIPLRSFGIDSDFKINFCSGGVRDGAPIFDSDILWNCNVSYAKPELLIDGHVSDLVKKSDAVCSDPRGDVDAQSDFGDIDTLYAHADEQHLYLGVSFFGEISSADTVPRYIRIYSKTRDRFLQFTWFANNMVNAAYFTEGMHFKDWDRSIFKDPLMLRVKYRIDRGMEAAIPMQLIESEEIKVTLIIAGMKDGNLNLYADMLETDLFRIPRIVE